MSRRFLPDSHWGVNVLKRLGRVSGIVPAEFDYRQSVPENPPIIPIEME